ncbi:MAG: virulence protein RhuM/Fic/DOC family protein, partial [Patescibacteria group bacterium]
MTKKVIKTEEKEKLFNSGTLVIYSGSKGGVELRADANKETIWATQTQIAELFEIDRTVATKHINNVFRDREIDEKSNVQKMHIPNSDKPITLYSLDIILAVGYRTNSAKAVKFRQWATRTLREYLIKGIVVNTERIKKLPDRILHDIIGKFEFIQRTLQNRELNKGESDSLLAVIHDYANSWLFLKEYDEGELKLRRSKNKEKRRLDYDFVRGMIDTMRVELISNGQASELFASERDQTFQGILKTIYQTFGGKELYSSLEEKAAHLLYFIIKDHPFSDGNKRVGSFLFISFLKLNGILTRPSGENKISDNTLVAL